MVSNANILVTGASGFFGQTLTSLLVKSGYKVIAQGRAPEYYHSISKYIRGDLTREQFFEALPPVTQIVHLAANVYRCNGPNCFIDNIYSTFLLLRWARHSGAKRIIYSSTSAVYKCSKDTLVSEQGTVGPEGLYASSKYLSEQILRVADIPTLIMRFSYLYGEENRKGALAKIIWQIKNGIAPVVRDEQRDYVHVKEAADAILSALNYSGNETCSILDPVGLLQ